MSGTEHIEYEGLSYALIVRNEIENTGLKFVTGNEDLLQLAHMRYPAGKLIQPHLHNSVVRTLNHTFEVLLIKKGKLKVTYYNAKRLPMGESTLYSGDVILLMFGGHGFEVLDELEMIEVKQGPYVGDADKIKF
ncbi:MAG: hypothetical protein WCG80_13565 [Spirochaetales bacterium]